MLNVRVSEKQLSGGAGGGGGGGIRSLPIHASISEAVSDSSASSHRAVSLRNRLPFKELRLHLHPIIGILPAGGQESIADPPLNGPHTHEASLIKPFSLHFFCFYLPSFSFFFLLEAGIKLDF